MSKVMINCRSLTQEEENKLYGKRTVNVGACFSHRHHLYQQHESFVLHINVADKSMFLVNKLHEGYLNGKLDNNEHARYVEIKPSEFENELADIILELKNIIS